MYVSIFINNYATNYDNNNEYINTESHSLWLMYIINKSISHGVRLIVLSRLSLCVIMVFYISQYLNTVIFCEMNL